MTLKEARSKWNRRRRQYVVGYVASGNSLYTTGRWVRHRTSEPMTRREAQALLDAMPSRGAVMFRLTPVAVAGGSR